MNPIEYLKNRFARDDRGAVLTEIALSVPLFMLVLTGTVETANYLLLNLKLQHTVIAISDLVTRDEQISEATMTDIFEAVPEIMAPFPVAANTSTIVSAISQTVDEPTSVYWQRSNGILNAASDFGAEGDPAALPAGLTLRDDETVLATEIFYSYEPLIFDFVPAQTLRKVAFYRPRIGALKEIQ